MLLIREVLKPKEGLTLVLLFLYAFIPFYSQITLRSGSGLSRRLHQRPLTRLQSTLP